MLCFLLSSDIIAHVVYRIWCDVGVQCINKSIYNSIIGFRLVGASIHIRFSFPVQKNTNKTHFYLENGLTKVLSAICYILYSARRKNSASCHSIKIWIFFSSWCWNSPNTDANKGGHWLSLSLSPYVPCRDVRKHFLLTTVKGQYRQSSTETERESASRSHPMHHVTLKQTCLLFFASQPAFRPGTIISIVMQLLLCSC